ncbi:5'-methylthioadenosine/S-adenosylhomocysteine nucleosidase [uncultured Jannaschia sp.]|uniref:5'-methylthioadenosine/S-adenosylhomocysteine nucleosidase n=1 Tax=uncultured Jannaschia sp. TaxID=293347 RepID=UPI0026170A55|nr:5'-methylthioadenosine/S-adenosylhomocysteine nucleosidase [uncultured Jannaschia sp.]
MPARPIAVALFLALPEAALADRIAVMSAFEPEWIALQDAIETPETRTINGNRFVSGTLEGQEVVLFLSGISMVNAAMTTQLALDHFDIRAIVFSGIAGGVDPSLGIGDVVVPAQWGGYLNAILARETSDGYAIPPWMNSDFAPFGMIHTRTEAVQSARMETPEEKFWYAADPDLLATAGALEVELPACNAEGTCLSRPPQIVTGGNGVSGAAFVDNAEVREWAFATFDAQVLDMESAAVAQVAYANEVPFIAFRSLSDLAGGGEGANEMGTFLSLAADNSAGVVRAFLAALD